MLRPSLLALLVAGLLGALLPAPAGAASQLPRFDSCPDLAGYGREFVKAGRAPSPRPTDMAQIVGPQFAVGGARPVPGLPVGGDVAYGGGPLATALPTAGSAAAPPAPAAPAPAPAALGSDAPGDPGTSTNTQETGVDEPDIVKTGNGLLYTATGGVLSIVDVGGATPRLLGRLRLPGDDHQLLLQGARVLVLSRVAEDEPAAGDVRRSGWLPERTLLTLVDVRDPAKPAVTDTLNIDGQPIAARLNGGLVRLVVASRPRAAAAPSRARRSYAKGRQGWMPVANLVHRRKKRTTTSARGLAACRTVRHPRRFSGLELTTVLTLDTARGLAPIDSDAVMSDAQVVYASAGSLYVATRRYVDPETDVARLGRATVTEIHRFDTTAGGETSYVGSGSVGGFLLNQFALSEHEGALRAATTDVPGWWDPASRSGGTESFVTVLRRKDGALRQIGKVGGMGKRELLTGVRFVGDVGYVVTFSQPLCDPVYTLDLSDPTQPRVRGQLDLPGFSSYLHDVGPGRLLGVGQEGGACIALRGGQISLFDVSTLDRPAMLARHRFGQQSQLATETDHHAFLHRPADGLLVLPVAQGDAPGAPSSFTGAVVLAVGRDSIAETGRVSHEGSPVLRALVVGGRLVTVSAGAVKLSALDGSAATGVALPPS